MFEKLRNFDIKHAKWFTVEFFRTIPFIVIAVLLFYPDWKTLLVVKYVFGFLFAIGLISHTIRKVLFPYISLRDYSKKSLETPMSAAIVFLSVSLILCTIMIVAADFFK